MMSVEIPKTAVPVLVGLGLLMMASTQGWVTTNEKARQISSEVVVLAMDKHMQEERMERDKDRAFFVGELGEIKEVLKDNQSTIKETLALAIKNRHELTPRPYWVEEQPRGGNIQSPESERYR